MIGIDTRSIRSKQELDLEVKYIIESIKVYEHERRECYQYTMMLPEQHYGVSLFLKWIHKGWALCNTSTRLLLI